MAVVHPLEVKKLLTSSGWTVYRICENEVFLAERVRENLIMEAHVSVLAGDPPRVRYLVRAQRSDFPSSSEKDERMFERARAMGAAGEAIGFHEVDAVVVPIRDPMEPNILLDTWFQVLYERETADEAALLDAVTGAMGVEKMAPR
jgi:hypothetical protein